MDQPFISVIIPVKPGGEVRALEALRAVDYPRELLEVMVAEGRQPSAQRNMAAREARGDLLYFLDDDSLPTPELFRLVAGKYRALDVVAAGGPIITPEDDTPLQKCFGRTLASPFGGSTIRARYKRLGKERYASENDLILANLSMRRDAFLDAGGFNERLYPNEENELMNRMQAAGHKFIYDPDAFLYRSQRKSYKDFVRQVFTYGRGRMEQNYAHPQGFRPLHLAPSFFLMYVLSLLGVHNLVWSLPAVVYISLAAGFSLSSLDELDAPGSRRCVFIMPLLFLTLHLGYGAGFIWGVFKGIFKAGDKQPEPGEITLRRVEV